MKAFNYLWTGKGVPIPGSQWLELWWPMKFLTSAVAADLPCLGPVPVKVMVTSSPATSALNLAESPLLKFWLYVRVPLASPSIRDRKKMILPSENREIVLTQDGDGPMQFIVVFPYKCLSPVHQSNDEFICVGVACICWDRRVVAMLLWRHQSVENNEKLAGMR